MSSFAFRAGSRVEQKRACHRTTDSRGVTRFDNLLTDFKLTGVNQVWVSDITYIRVGDGFCYLILITDAYSHQVVGHNFGACMDAAFCLVALEMALASRQDPAGELVHHSDRGLQYCSKLYTGMLKGEGIAISMTESGDPLENAVAERMNGILKDSFEVDRTFSSFEEARQFILEAIHYYNNRRPHSSCDNLTPKEASARTGTLKRHWKGFAEKAAAKAEREAQGKGQGE